MEPIPSKHIVSVSVFLIDTVFFIFLFRLFGAAVAHLCLLGSLQSGSGCRDWDWRGMSRVFYTTAGTTWSSSGTYTHTLRHVNVHALVRAFTCNNFSELLKTCS